MSLTQKQKKANPTIQYKCKKCGFITHAKRKSNCELAKKCWTCMTRGHRNKK